MITKDESGIIVSWLVRLAIWMAIVGVVLFDAGSIAVNFFNLDSTADDIAIQISTDIQSGQAVNQQALEADTKALADEAGAKLVKVEVDSEGRVRVHLKRVAETLVVKRIGPIEDWAKATAEGVAGTN